MERLSTDTSVTFVIAAGEAFQSRELATERALFPNLVLVPGTSNSPKSETNTSL